MRTLILLFCIVLQSSAMTPAPAENQQVRSFNKKFILKVDADTKVHKIYTAANLNKPLWQFSAGVWNAPFLISNDGKVVAKITYNYIQEKFRLKNEQLDKLACVSFWREGKEWTSYRFKGVYPAAEQLKYYYLAKAIEGLPPLKSEAHPPIEEAQKLIRSWHKELAVHDDHFSLLLTNGKVVSFSMKSAERVESPKQKLFPLKEVNKLDVKYSPSTRDSDGDGISDIQELDYNLDPNDPRDAREDRDGDGFSNWDEIKNHPESTDTEDASDHPPIIQRCHLLQIKEGKILLFNGLTGETRTLSKGLFSLKGKAGKEESYLLKSFDAKSLKVVAIKTTKEYQVTQQPHSAQPKVQPKKHKKVK